MTGCQPLAFWLSGRPVPSSILTGYPAVEVRAAGQGRGLGVFATQFIPSFAQILVDSPMVTMRPEEDLPELYLRFRNLSQPEQQEYLALSHREDANRDTLLKDKLLQRGFALPELETIAMVANVMQTNAFNVDLGDGLGSNHRAIFPHVARINHACAPNAHVCFYPPSGPGTRGLMVIHSLKQIRPGDEILISYFNILLPRSERQQKARKWGFECNCSVCTGPQHMEAVRASFRDFSAQQARLVQSRRVTIKDIKALVRKGEALAASSENTSELFPALPELMDGLGMLQAKALAVQKREMEREPVLEALGEAILWEARITGHDSPAAGKRLKKLKDFAARQDDLATPYVVRANGGYAIAWKQDQS